MRFWFLAAQNWSAIEKSGIISDAWREKELAVRERFEMKLSAGLNIFRRSPSKAVTVIRPDGCNGTSLGGRFFVTVAGSFLSKD
jgi:hypothetical protein